MAAGIALRYKTGPRLDTYSQQLTRHTCPSNGCTHCTTAYISHATFPRLAAALDFALFRGDH